MEHSIALVTGATSGLVTSQPARPPLRATARSLTPDAAAWPGFRKRPLNSRLRPKGQVFTLLELDTPASVQSALAELVKRGRRVDFLLPNARMVPGEKRALTAAGIEASQTPLNGHHQLTVGLLHSASN